jgi:hypothetical protein
MKQNTSPTTSCIFLGTAKSEDSRDLEAVRWVHMDSYADESTFHVSVASSDHQSRCTILGPEGHGDTLFEVAQK